jgi:osmotically-inducible protein OsmY
MNMHARTLVASLALVIASIARAQTAPDNSKQNSTDPMNKSVTADTQKNDAADLQLTKQIRASLIADKSLSTYAHNIKIVAVNGNVTLNGVVRTEREKEAIEAKAQALVNNGSLVDNLKIAP